jgi:CrcB protein
VSPTPPPRGLALAAVALGGALGALLRAGLLDALPSSAAWTVLGINVSGCLLLALLPAAAVVRRRPLLALLLGPGLLGGYTTLSAVAEQTRAMAASGDSGAAAGYVVVSVAAGLLAVRVATRWVEAGWWGPFEDEGGDL